MFNNVLSDEVQLGLALEAFSWAHRMGAGWAVRNLLYFRNAGINSMADLQQGCTQNTVNLDLELFGIPADELLSDETIRSLRSFLPGPVGFRCFRLAQKAAEKVLLGTADTEYVHRPASGKKGDEQWTLPTDGSSWTLNVDCAGFVRNCLKHVTKDPFRMLLSDRDFMRAKDFYGFFSAIPYTVMDRTEIPDSPDDRNARWRMKWRLVPDLRMVIPGDVIVYRPRGNAAGGAAFTENDRRDLARLLRAVKAAQLFREMKREWDSMGAATRNVAKDAAVRPWVQAVKAKLGAVGIATVRDLRRNLAAGGVNGRLRAAGHTALSPDTLRLMQECAETTALNTGHIVFAAGIAEDKGDNEYRIRVVHSTKFGKKDVNGEVTTGVQEHYRRFRLARDADGKEFWTRNARDVLPEPKEQQPATTATATNNSTTGTGSAVDGCGGGCGTGAVSDDEMDNPNDDMEEDNDGQDAGMMDAPSSSAVTVVDDPVEAAAPTDELSGQSEVVVLAARMCF